MTVKNGIVCFTFDDRNFDGWIKSVDVFKKYNATASFFISGEIDNEALCAAKELYKAGHTVGLHTKNHADAPEYFEKLGAKAYFENEIMQQKQRLEENGIKVTSFAYPNNRRNDDTDAFLSQYFRRFRAGNSNCSQKYIPVELLEQERVMGGFGIGEYYKTVKQDIFEKITFAAKQNVCMTFFSHNIKPDACHIDMQSELLEEALCVAQNEEVAVIGFDELP